MAAGRETRLRGKHRTEVTEARRVKLGVLKSLDQEHSLASCVNDVQLGKSTHRLGRSDKTFQHARNLQFLLRDLRDLCAMLSLNSFLAQKPRRPPKTFRPNPNSSSVTSVTSVRCSPLNLVLAQQPRRPQRPFNPQPQFPPL